MKAGFIGLGRLGRTLAERLISEGVELTVWNRTKSKAEGLNAEVVGRPAGVFIKADIVFMNLFDSSAVWDVLAGDGGFISEHYQSKKIIIDTTTNHFKTVLDFHRLVEANGGTYLESPVLGSIAPASQGKLTVLISGREDAYREARPLIEKIGSMIYFLETPGLASRMKLVNNMVLGSFMSALAEAVSFAEASGLKKEDALEMLGHGAGNSSVLNAKKDKLADADFSPHFTSSLIYKDLHYLQDLARELSMPAFNASFAKEFYASAIAKGMADEDFSSVYKVFAEYGKRKA